MPQTKFKEGMRVRGVVRLGDSNLAEIISMEPIPRRKLSELVKKLFTQKPDQKE